MAIKFTDTQHYADIADAIRAKNGSSDTYTPAEMAQAIEDIPSGGGTPQALLDLIKGTASGVVTLTDALDFSSIRLILGHVDNMNPVTELHLPNLTSWGYANANYLSRGGGIMCVAPEASLRVLDIPKCKYITINNYALNSNINCFTNLQSLNAPELIGFNGSLRGSAIPVVSFPKLKRFGGNNIFMICTALTTVDLGGCEDPIPYNAFYGCSALTALILRRNTAITPMSGNAFTNTPIASGTGYIYVPRDLIATYQAATNWSTYASQFRALEDYADDGTVDGEFIPPAN